MIRIMLLIKKVESLATISKPEGYDSPILRHGAKNVRSKISTEKKW
jgi:hypothetical protein